MKLERGEIVHCEDLFYDVENDVCKPHYFLIISNQHAHDLDKRYLAVMISTVYHEPIDELGFEIKPTMLVTGEMTKRSMVRKHLVFSVHEDEIERREDRAQIKTEYVDEIISYINERLLDYEVEI